MTKDINNLNGANGKSFFINGSINKNLNSGLLRELNEHLKNSHPDSILKWGFHNFAEKMVVGTGFGPSGILLIHRLVTLKLPVAVFYLDTGLLFEETFQLKDELENRFGIEFYPVRSVLSVDKQAKKFGNQLWKRNPDKCCEIRKVIPLQHYLIDKMAWVTGIRRSQAYTRKETNVIEWDPLNQVVKINPLAFWSNDQVWDYIAEHNLPYNPLHDYGYPTIGCIPCTNQVETGEEVRSGRWGNHKKIECGIHLPAQNYKNGTEKL